MERLVTPELLDELPPQDRQALRSRRDIRRLNGWMRHPSMMAGLLQQSLDGRAGCRVVELGAGDGQFLLSVARRLRKRWRAAEATLVDRLDAVNPEMRESFGDIGWRIRVEVADAVEWLRRAPPGNAGVVLSNLLLHQLPAETLAEFLRLAARAAPVVIALEPRRAWWPHFCARFLWLAGCGRVTRHDSLASIRAGFAGRELSALWPEAGRWELTERSSGMFSHMFIARRME
jgi:hypothetical protein